MTHVDVHLRHLISFPPKPTGAERTHKSGRSGARNASVSASGSVSPKGKRAFPFVCFALKGNLACEEMEESMVQINPKNTEKKQIPLKYLSKLILNQRFTRVFSLPFTW